VKPNAPHYNLGLTPKILYRYASPTDLVPRRVTDLAECLAFGASATHRALGQESNIGGLITENVDIYGETEIENHGTQRDNGIQGISDADHNVLRLYERLLQKAEIPQNYDIDLGPDRTSQTQS